MADPNFGKITDEGVARLRQQVGAGLAASHWQLKDPAVPPPSPVPHQMPHNTEATIDAFRHYISGLGDDNPLYFDPSYAAATRWNGPIAPPLFVWTMGEPDDPEGMEPSAEYKSLLKGDPIRGTGALQADLQYEFYRPIRLGDRIYRRQTFIGLQDKRSSWGGRAIHSWRGVATRNQNNEIVHLQRGMWIRAERRPVSEIKEPQPAPEPYTDEQLDQIDACYADHQRRGAEPRFWEDVQIGDELPAKVKGPLRVTDLIVWHVGWGMQFQTHAFDFAYRTRQATPGLYTRTPLNVPDIVQRMHWEEEWAHKVGAAARYDFGGLREAFLMHLITDWMGDNAWLWKLSVQHRKFFYIGDTAWVKGLVTGKEEVEGRHEVHLAVECVNQRGMTISPGTAIVVLPSRATGDIVMPKPAVEDTVGLLMHDIEFIAAAYDDDLEAPLGKE
jgi:acyl dehydratase